MRQIVQVCGNISRPIDICVGNYIYVVPKDGTIFMHIYRKVKQDGTQYATVKKCT